MPHLFEWFCSSMSQLATMADDRQFLIGDISFQPFLGHVSWRILKYVWGTLLAPIDCVRTNRHCFVVFQS